MEERLAPSATYYISPSGNDSRDGLSPQTAWRTINKVNAHAYQAGDTYLFQGGATFNGAISVYYTGSSPANPITFSSYGTGRATINSGNSRGIWAATAGGLHINNLNLVGSGVNTNALNGIDISNIGHASNIAIDQVDVRGYGFAGISVSSDSTYGMSGISLTNSRVHHNANGISIGNGDSPVRVISDVYIGNVEADHNNSTSSPMAGIGILLNNITGGIVERSLLHDNGSTSTPAGHAGLLAYDSSFLTVQYNETYGHSDPTASDGQGIVFAGVTDSVIQFNYSHDNTFGGIQLTSDWPFQGSTERVTIRYNVLENNRSSLVVFHKVFDSDIYNNTAYTQPGPNGEFGSPLIVGFWEGSGVRIRNNIFQAAGGLPVVLVEESSLVGVRDLQFQANVYHGLGLDPEMETYIVWGGTYFSTLNDFRATTGQELISGVPTGTAADPQLVNPGGGGTIGDANALSSLSAYHLQETSPLRYYSGLDLPTYFATNPGVQDFFGNDLPEAGFFSVGAHHAPVEFGGQGPATGPSRLTEHEAPAAVESLDAYALSALTVHEGHSTWSGPRFFRPVSLV